MPSLIKLYVGTPLIISLLFLVLQTSRKSSNRGIGFIAQVIGNFIHVYILFPISCSKAVVFNLFLLHDKKHIPIHSEKADFDKTIFSRIRQIH